MQKIIYLEQADGDIIQLYVYDLGDSFRVALDYTYFPVVGSLRESVTRVMAEVNKSMWAKYPEYWIVHTNGQNALIDQIEKVLTHVAENPEKAVVSGLVPTVVCWVELDGKTRYGWNYQPLGATGNPDVKQGDLHYPYYKSWSVVWQYESTLA